MESFTESITALEKKFWDAQVDRNIRFFDETLADDARIIGGFGFADKRTIIKSIALGIVQFASYALRDVHVHTLGEGAASISYRCVIQAAVQGQPHTITVTVTTVYVKHGETWQIVLHQQTPVQQ